jgi:hypothetical protein
MALTNAQVREILSAAGVPTENVAEAVQKIMDGHITSVNALREQRDAYKADAEKLPDVQKELDALKAKGDQDWQKRYEDEHTAFETYKTEIANEKVRAEKVELYRKALKECNVGEKQIGNILKVSGDVIDKLSIKDGQIDDLDVLKQNIQNEWSGFIMKSKDKGAGVDTPPMNGGDSGAKVESRAAKLAAEYHKNLYGETKGE